MPKINQRTLKLLCEFFQEVTDHEANDLDKDVGDDTLCNKGNRMTSYNIAVTVGPNIFRATNEEATSIMDHAIYYDAFMRMIDNFDDLFSIDRDQDFLNDNKLNQKLSKHGRKSRIKNQDDNDGVLNIGGKENMAKILGAGKADAETPRSANSDSSDFLAQMDKAD